MGKKMTSTDARFYRSLQPGYRRDLARRKRQLAAAPLMEQAILEILRGLAGAYKIEGEFHDGLRWSLGEDWVARVTLQARTAIRMLTEAQQ